MGVKVTILLVFTLLDCSLANPEKKNCSDCVGFKTCDAAVVAIAKTDPVVDDQLRSVFCGFDDDGLPMICCSELITRLIATHQQTPLENIEKHPNVRLLPENCGFRHDDDLDKYIIGGGREAGLYEFPWMALLSYKTRQGPQWKCGGSLINELYVLTAAHCIFDQELFGVRIGEHNLDTVPDCHWIYRTCESKTQDMRIEEAIPHPEYQTLPALRNDIGLLRLKKPVGLSFKNARIICLPFSDYLINRTAEERSYGTVAGWGYTEKGYASSALRTANVPIHGAQYCRDLYYKGRKPSEEDEMTNKICSGSDGRDACKGDSGGPLMVRTRYFGGGKNQTEGRREIRYRLIQYGIVSYGPRVCGSDFPGIYTDVTKYMKWILDTIKL